MNFTFISFNDSDPTQPEQCDMNILKVQFPHIDEYFKDNNTCSMSL